MDSESRNVSISTSFSLYLLFTIYVYLYLPHVRRKVELTGVAGHHVSLERFFPVELESIHGCENHDFVVHALTRQPLEIGRERDGRHAVHTRIRNVLHVNRNVPELSIEFPINHITNYLTHHINRNPKF